MGGLKGDFISFSFNGVHSSELGITRTSDGSRYNENLLPTIQDKTVQVPGADGTYFFGSFYTQRQFNVPIAFDSLTEVEYRRLRQHFGDKGIHELIFDERPYKVYMAKATGTPQLKTICFDGEDKDGNPCRIYKGEGTLTFTAYYPFARSRFKYLDKYTNKNIYPWEEWSNEQGESLISNIEEWRDSSNLLSSKGEYDLVDYKTISSIKLYNAGDIETDIKIYFSFHNVSSREPFSVKLYQKDSNGTEITVGQLNFSKMELYNNENVRFCIDTKKNLVEGCNKEYKLSGHLYNEYIKSGEFFKIPLGESRLEVTIEGDRPLDENNNEAGYPMKIEYDYIYY